MAGLDIGREIDPRSTHRWIVIECEIHPHSAQIDRGVDGGYLGCP